MNIERKRSLYREVFSVLRPGGRFGFYDIVGGVAGEPDFPMPWASRPTESFLVSPSTMQRLAEEAGFRTVTLRDLTNTARSNMMRQEEAAAPVKAAGEAPPLPARALLLGPAASEKTGGAACTGRVCPNV